MFARGKRHRGSFERPQKSAYGLELGEVDQSLKGSTFLLVGQLFPARIGAELSWRHKRRK
jgi:hypothetical protein